MLYIGMIDLQDNLNGACVKFIYDVLLQIPYWGQYWIPTIAEGIIWWKFPNSPICPQWPKPEQDLHWVTTALASMIQNG
jgi:hypothetical protein